MQHGWQEFMYNGVSNKNKYRTYHLGKYISATRFNGTTREKATISWASNSLYSRYRHMRRRNGGHATKHPCETTQLEQCFIFEKCDGRTCRNVEYGCKRTWPQSWISLNFLLMRICEKAKRWKFNSHVATAAPSCDRPTLLRQPFRRYGDKYSSSKYGLIDWSDMIMRIWDKPEESSRECLYHNHGTLLMNCRLAQQVSSYLTCESLQQDSNIGYCWRKKHDNQPFIYTFETSVAGRSFSRNASDWRQ